MQQISSFYSRLLQFVNRERTYKVGVEVSFFNRTIYQYIEVKARGRNDAIKKAMQRSKFATSTDIKFIKRLKQ